MNSGFRKDTYNHTKQRDFTCSLQRNNQVVISTTCSDVIQRTSCMLRCWQSTLVKCLFLRFFLLLFWCLRVGFVQQKSVPSLLRMSLFRVFKIINLSGYPRLLSAPCYPPGYPMFSTGWHFLESPSSNNWMWIIIVYAKQNYRHAWIFSGKLYKHNEST